VARDDRHHEPHLAWWCDCGLHGPDHVGDGRGGPLVSRRAALRVGLAAGGVAAGWTLGGVEAAGARVRSPQELWTPGQEPGEALPGEELAGEQMDPGGDPMAAGAAAAIQVAPPPIVTRAEWGADETLGDRQRSFAVIRKLQVHHTATAAPVDGAAACRSILQFHTQGNGWSDIGYNFLVDPAGTIYEGRWARTYDGGELHDGEDRSGLGVVGAHTAGYNTGGCGIALLGTFTSITPSQAATASLVHLLAWKAGPRGIDPVGADQFTPFGSSSSETFPNITGHRDLGNTACPGDRTYAMLGDIRARVRARIGTGFIGYRILAADGRIQHLGGALDRGSTRSLGLGTDVVAIAPGPDADAYWVLGRDGGIFSFGSAAYHGSVPGVGVRTRVVDLTPTASGRGYWILGEDGGVFSFGDANFFGSVPGVGVRTTGLKLRRTPSGNGYWVVAVDGGVFSFGDARFHGSLPGVGVSTRVADLAPTPTGDGYWIVGEDGGVFAFGDARYHGSVPGLGVGWARPARAIVASATGQGYVVLSDTGKVYNFGDAPNYGDLSGTPLRALGLAPAIQP
jgi:hypothetical protein